MKTDRVMNEVWKAKDALGKRFGFDIRRMGEHFRRLEYPLPAIKLASKSKVKSIVKKAARRLRANAQRIGQGASRARKKWPLSHFYGVG